MDQQGPKEGPLLVLYPVAKLGQREVGGIDCAAVAEPERGRDNPRPILAWLVQRDRKEDAGVYDHSRRSVRFSSSPPPDLLLERTHCSAVRCMVVLLLP